MTSAQQVIMVSAAFTAGVEALAAETGALSQIAHGAGAFGSISYDDLDRVPEIHGSLINLDSFATYEPLTVEELMENKFYKVLVGEKLFGQQFPLQFGMQQLILQHIVNGLTPELAESRKLVTALKDRYPEDHVWLGAASFIEGVSLIKSGEGNSKGAVKALGRAAFNFEHADLFGAAGVAFAAMGRDSEGLEREVINRQIEKELLRSMEKDGLESELGIDYLYGLHLSKRYEIWRDMRSFFFIAGRVHANRGHYDAAVRAYIASVWAFSKMSFAISNERNDAVRALNEVTDLSHAAPSCHHEGHPLNGMKAYERVDPLIRELKTAASLPAYRPPSGGYFIE